MSPSSRHPKVRQISAFLQGVARVIRTCELLRTSMLDMLQLLHSVLVFLLKPMRSFTTELRQPVGFVLLFVALPHSAVRPSLGICSTPCSSTRWCGASDLPLHAKRKPLAEFLTALQSIIPKQCISSTLMRDSGSTSETAIQSSTTKWWKIVSASAPICLIAVKSAALSSSLSATSLQDTSPKSPSNRTSLSRTVKSRTGRSGLSSSGSPGGIGGASAGHLFAAPLQ